jgi:hypothetical protein
VASAFVTNADKTIRCLAQQGSNGTQALLQYAQATPNEVRGLMDIDLFRVIPRLPRYTTSNCLTVLTAQEKLS